MTRRPCTTCGRTCVSPGGVCNDCRRSANWSTPDPSDALRGGRWVGRGGIMRWEPMPDAPPEPVEVRDPAEVIACTRCHATAVETCRTRTGQRAKDHAERQVPRCCPCGSILGHNQRLCPACARERQIVRTRRWHYRQMEEAS